MITPTFSILNSQFSILNLLPFRVERTHHRTSRARFEGDSIVIRLARNLPQAEEQRHIDVLLKRMAKAHAHMRNMRVIDPFRPLLGGGKSLTLTFDDGHTVNFEVVSSERTRARKVETSWRIEHSERISEPSFHRFLWKLLSISEKDRMQSRVHAINAATLRVAMTNVGLRLTRSQWGSCSHTGSINLSTALLFVPLPLQHYVIVHELAHRLHLNHSKAFWRTVETHVPEYRKKVKELRGIRLPQIEVSGTSCSTPPASSRLRLRASEAASPNFFGNIQT